MHSLILKVNADDMSWEIPIERRITIVRGDSGNGKSTLVDYVSSPNPAVHVDFPMRIAVADYTTWEAVMGMHNTLIILDDLEIVSSSMFARLIKETVSNNNYYLIIARERVGIKDFNELSISVNSILKMVTSEDGKIHTTVPFYDLGSTKVNNLKLHHIITEDNKAGRIFFINMFGEDKVTSTKVGKSGIVPKTIEYLDSTDNKVLVLVDMAAYGCHMDQFVHQVYEKYKGRVFIKFDYECFEEILVRSNILKDNIIIKTELFNIYEYANKFISWETYFENLIERATRDLVFYHGHETRLKHCWKGSCTECRKDSKRCKFYIEGDKITGLLKGTKYNWLLVIKHNMIM